MNRLMLLLIIFACAAINTAAQGNRKPLSNDDFGTPKAAPKTAPANNEAVITIKSRPHEVIDLHNNVRLKVARVINEDFINVPLKHTSYIINLHFELKKLAVAPTFSLQYAGEALSPFGKPYVAFLNYETQSIVPAAIIMPDSNKERYLIRVQGEGTRDFTLHEKDDVSILFDLPAEVTSKKEVQLFFNMDGKKYNVVVTLD
jgi:hypothetical protein